MDTQNLAMALRSAYLAVHRRTNAALHEYGVTADQFVCLVILDELNGLTQQELAGRAMSDPNTIRAMLLLLERKGLIVRTRHPNDKRAHCVSMTGKGRVVFRKLVRVLRPVRRQMLDPFSEKELSAVLAALNHLTSTVLRQSH